MTEELIGLELNCSFLIKFSVRACEKQIYKTLLRLIKMPVCLIKSVLANPSLCQPFCSLNPSWSPQQVELKFTKLLHRYYINPFFSG